jgi:hypothetical protein
MWGRGGPPSVAAMLPIARLTLLIFATGVLAGTPATAALAGVTDTIAPDVRIERPGSR